MAKINSFSQLKSELQRARTEALVNASDEATEYIRMDVMDDVVYGAGNPNFYERTYQLQNSLTDRPVTGAAEETASVLINHDTSLIRFQPDNRQHGNHTSGDVSDFIPMIVHDGLSGNAFGDGFWRPARPYMDEAVKRLSGGKFRGMMVKELRGMGLNAK